MKLFGHIMLRNVGTMSGLHLREREGYSHFVSHTNDLDAQDGCADNNVGKHVSGVRESHSDLVHTSP